MSNVARKILFNTFSQVAAKLVLAVFGIVTLKILTNFLDISGYGFYRSIYEYLALFAIVSDLGLYTIGVREMTKAPEKEEIILGNLFTIRTIMIILIIGIAIISTLFIPAFNGPLTWLFQGQSSMPAGPAPWTVAAWSILIAGVTTVFAILTGTVSTTLQVHLKMEWNALGSVIGKIVALAWMVFVTFIWFPHCQDGETLTFLNQASSCNISENSFYLLLFAGIIGNIAMFLITFWPANKITKIRYRFDWAIWKDVVWKSLPYGIALILNQIIFRLGSISLLTMKSTTEVGLYGAPLTILEAAGVVPLYFMNAILPLLTKSLNTKDGNHHKIIQYSFDFLMMASLPIAAGTFILAYQVIALVASPSFLSNPATGFFGSDGVLQILIVAIVFSFMNGLFGYILIAANQQQKMLSRNASAVVLTIILHAFLIPVYSIQGAAFSNIITEIYITLASFWLAKRFVDFKLSLLPFAKVIFCTAFMSVVLYFGKLYFVDSNFTKTPWALFQALLPSVSTERLIGIQHLITLLSLIIISGLIYLIGLFLTRVLTKDMVAMVLKRKPKEAPAVATGLTDNNLN